MRLHLTTTNYRSLERRSKPETEGRSVFRMSSRVWSLFRQSQYCGFFKCLRRMPHFPRNLPSKFLSSSVCVKSHEDEEFNVLSLANGDLDMEKKLKVMLLELDVARQEGGKVPDVLEPEEWKELILLESRSGRRKFLEFCWKKQMQKRSDRRKKEEQKLKNEEFLKYREGVSRDPMAYQLGGNAIFLRISDSAIDGFLNSKLIQAMQFGQEIVVDCGYEKDMTRAEVANCAKQLTITFSDNRAHSNPFNLYFCNARRGGTLMTEFQKRVTCAYEKHFPLNITEKCYLDLFPKNKIVYLTPHCREELVKFDNDTVYVIGGLVDKSNHNPLTLGKAKEQGLRMAKLPLDKYLTFSSGSGKNLTINQMISILLDLKKTGKWDVALEHVPKRKLLRNYEVDLNANKFKLIDGRNWGIAFNKPASKKRNR